MTARYREKYLCWSDWNISKETWSRQEILLSNGTEPNRPKQHHFFPDKQQNTSKIHTYERSQCHRRVWFDIIELTKFFELLNTNKICECFKRVGHISETIKSNVSVRLHASHSGALVKKYLRAWLMRNWSELLSTHTTQHNHLPDNFSAPSAPHHMVHTTPVIPVSHLQQWWSWSMVLCNNNNCPVVTQ